MNSIKELVSALCKAEKGKSEIRVGDMREAIAKLSDLMYENPEIADMLIKNGKARAKGRA